MNRPSCREGGGPRGRGVRLAAVDAVTLCALALTLAGCGSSPEEVRAQARASRGEVTALSRDVLRQLASLTTLRFSATHWTGCDDFGGKVRYEVSGRLEPAAQSEVPLIVRVTDRLAARGMRPALTVPRDADPVIREVVRDGINLRFYGYGNQPFVLFDITGPCLDVDDLDRDLIDRPPVPLRLDES